MEAFIIAHETPLLIAVIVVGLASKVWLIWGMSRDCVFKEDGEQNARQ